MKSFRNTFLLDNTSTSEKVNTHLIIANSDRNNASILKRLWDNSYIKICADGGANRLYDSLKPENIVSNYIPNYIVGDLDSLRDDVRDFYR
jgi:thiamine pyrophosphokinase